RASQVPGEPNVPMPCSATPAGPAHQAATVCRRGPRTAKAEDSTAGNLSRGSVARRQHWLSTLRSAGYPAPRKTRFRLLARLYRVGLLTHRVPTKGFEGAIVTSCAPLPSFAWRNG